MENRKFGLLALHITFMSISLLFGTTIQLYRSEDYSCLSFVVTLKNMSCYNIPDEDRDDILSVITDSCFITYCSSDCVSRGTRKYMPGKSRTPEAYCKLTKSIKKFNDQEGGPLLNVDITTYIDKWARLPKILESYHDVCSCINIPKYVQNMKALYIDAGHWKTSWGIHLNKRNYNGTKLKIMALGPASNCTYFQESCLTYTNNKIMRIEVQELLKNDSSLATYISANRRTTKFPSVPNKDLIHFYADYDYQGFHFGSWSTSNCNFFPKPVQQRWIHGVRSIKTETCLIVYSFDDCTGRSIKIEAPGTTNLTTKWESILKGEHTLSLLYNQTRTGKWETKSYHVCNNEIGGPSLNVDILSNDPEISPFPTNEPVVLESFRNLCECRNVPKNIQTLKYWSVDNNGNEMMAYFSPDCVSSTHSPLKIPAGHSSYSFGLGLFEAVDQTTGVHHKIKSFGPDLSSDYYIKSCNENCREMSLFGILNNTSVNVKNICNFDTQTESMKIALISASSTKAIDAKLQGLMEGFQALAKGLQVLSQKVDSLQPIHEQAALNLENIKHEFNDQLEKQKDEIRELSDKLNSQNPE